MKSHFEFFGLTMPKIMFDAMKIQLQVQMTSPDDPRFSDDEHSSSNLRFAISMCWQLLNGTTSHANYTLLNIYKTPALANKLTMG